MAWRFTVSLGRDTSYWRTLVVVNTTYWYLWALFTPAIIWLSQHFRFERQGLWRAVLVHLPSVVIFSLAHILTMSGVQWWVWRAQGRSFAWWPEAQKAALLNFDWEMMTHWTIVGLSHAVLYYRESRIARSVPLNSKRGWSRRSSRRRSSSSIRTSSSTRCTPSPR